MNIKLHSVIESSKVNGPGDRFVIWTQGCDKACPQCYNPETWDEKGGYIKKIEDLAKMTLESGADGITVTGGDPLNQPEALLEFLTIIEDFEEKFPKGVICFTGFTLEEILALEGSFGDAARQCLKYIDLLIDGRFELDKRIDHVLAGSSNQKFHFLDKPGRGKDKIDPLEVKIDQAVEIHGGENYFEITGFPEINRRWLKKHGLKIIN